MDIIAVDVDDVCLDLTPTLLKYFNADHGTEYTEEVFTEWNIAACLGKEAEEYFGKLFDSASVYFESSPVPDALDTINQLKLYFRVVYVTANNPGGIKKWWLEEHGFLECDKDFVQAYDKTLIRAKYLIDDRYENCLAFLDYGSSFLYDRPWNRKYQNPRISRIRSWKEFG